MCREKKGGKKYTKTLTMLFFLTSDLICWFVLSCLLIFFLQPTHYTFMTKTNRPSRDIIYRLEGKKSQFPATLKLRITHPKPALM